MVVIITLYLYYGNEDSSNLKECDVMENYTGEESKEEFIVKRLIEGPDEKGYNRIFPKDVSYSAINSNSFIILTILHCIYINILPQILYRYSVYLMIIQ